jgi:HPt (histidine-containing phosphotransfer) domain-containing protein
VEETPAEKAVHKFGGAKNELREFMDDNDDFIQELRRLIENYNAGIREAVHALKSQLKESDLARLVVGEFGVMKKRREWWDGQALAASVPQDKQELFLAAKTIYEVDVSKLEQLLRQGEIDADIARQAFHEDDPSLSLMPGSPKELNF